MQNGLSVREMLGQQGTKPEELTASEDIKKMRHRVNSIDHIEVYHAEKQDGIIMERHRCQLRPGTGCSMNFSENKKAECPLQDTQIL